jgi:hypothetical protein
MILAFRMIFPRPDPAASVEACSRPPAPRAAVSHWRRFLCALFGHRYVTTHMHLCTGEAIFRVRVCNRCGRRDVEIIR